MKTFLKFGHRGAPGHPRFGENTMPSFRKAIEAGADGLETDLRKTKDGVLVLLHDKTLDRITNGKGNVNDLTYAQLRKFKTDNDSYIPTLEEFLREFGGHGKLFLELKEGGITHQVKEMIIGLNLAKNTVLIAFDEDDRMPDASSSWEELKDLLPEVKIGLLASPQKIERLSEKGLIEAALKLNVYSINLRADAISPLLIEMAHDKGLHIFAWTINKTEYAKQLNAMGVDGFFSDLPDLLS